jgi:antitoxin CptB
MSGTTRSSQGLDPARRRILYRAWHRGTKEMDLVMGRFVDAELDSFSDEDLVDMEHMIEALDHDLYDWIVGKKPVPGEYDTPVFRRLRAFYAGFKPDALA